MFSLDIAGIAISCFFIFFIITKKKKKNADWILLLNNITIIALLVADAMFQQKLTALNIFLLNVVPLFLLPLFLLFALETLQETIHHRGRWMLLFVPALITSVYIGADLFVFNHYNSVELDALYNHPKLLYHIFCKGFPVVFLGTFVWLIRRLNVYATHIKEQFSFIDPIRLNWLTNSTLIYIFITLVSVIGFVAAQTRVLPITSHFVCMLVGTLLFVAIFYMSFYGIQQYSISEYYQPKTVQEIEVAAVEAFVDEKTTPDDPVIPNLPVVEPELPMVEAEQPVKYKSSSLSNEEIQLIYEKACALFEKEKLYQEPKLQISDVAEKLAVSSHVLSQAINSIAGKPFYDFVNGYRVRHLQKLLEDPAQQKFTILSLGFESGFNSKASLNRVFRQETGLSPSEYLQRYQQNQVSIS